MPRLEACLDLDPNYLSYLKSIKVFTVYDFINIDTDKLTTSSMLAKDILSLKHNLISQCCKYGENAALRCEVSLKKTAVLPTSIKSLDDLLNGGFETGCLYEITGLSGAGKTQLCLTIVANVVSMLKRKVFFLDTKNDFSASRLEGILEAQNLSSEEISSCMNKVDVFSICDLYDIIAKVQSIRESFKSSGKYNYRLLVVDSMTAPFLEFIGSRHLDKGFGLLTEAGAALKRLAREMHLAIVVTNLAVRYNEGEPDICGAETELSAEESIRPAMGRPWAHIPNTRISLHSTGSPHTFVLTVTKSNCLPFRESAVINLSSKGIT